MEMEEVDRMLAGYLDTSPALPASKLMQLHQLSSHIKAANNPGEEEATTTGVQEVGEESGGEEGGEEGEEEGEEQAGSGSDSGSMSI